MQPCTQVGFSGAYHACTASAEQSTKCRATGSSQLQQGSGAVSFSHADDEVRRRADRALGYFASLVMILMPVNLS